MAEGQKFVDIGAFDASFVDLNSAPMSAEQYIQQVVADRYRCKDVVSVNKPVERIGIPQCSASSSTVKSRDELAPDANWVEAKAEEFRRFREKIEIAAPAAKKLHISWPQTSHEDEWRELVLDKCHPMATDLLSQFPNHVGTPPSLSVVLALQQVQVCTLIQYLVEWADEEGLRRPIREWLYCLLLVLETPVLHDVISALRELAKQCRSIRNRLPAEQTEERLEFSAFIAIISIVFSQRDLCD